MTRSKNNVMRAATIDRFGGIETLAVKTIPIPDVGADEVLIRIESAGVGVWDAFEREGRFHEMGMAESEPRFPYVLGSDCAGRVERVGENVSEFQAGDPVYAFGLLNPKGGCYAEYVVLHASQVAHLPGNVPAAEGGAMPVDAMTALRGLDLLKIQEGQSVLIFGASGGIGHLAVQLAKRMGARVFAVASGDDGVHLALDLGADAAVDGKKDDVARAAGEFAPEGFDAALVTAGGEAANRAIAGVRTGGRVAYPNGVMPEPVPPPGVTASAYDGLPDVEAIARLNDLIDAGPFEVHVDKTFDLDHAADAQRALDAHHLGKIALKP